jgi:hypothetical protein
VSSLQTAIPPATLGSSHGQHRFHPAAVVREGQPGEATFTPSFGRIELTARAVADPRCMVALWMIGLEGRPERSGVLCVAEIFGRDVRPDRARVGLGIHAFGDPLLTEDFEAVEVRIDVTEMHTYGADWRPDGVDFTIDGRLVRSLRQSPGYPLQLMLGIYEFPPEDQEQDPSRDPSDYPKIFEVASVRGRPA